MCDRYVDSSLAYQGIARGLGVEHVLELNLQATQGLLPDRTFLVVLDAEEAARRATGDADRIEREGIEFQAAVGRAYEELAAMFPERITKLDGSRPAAELARIVRDERSRAFLSRRRPSACSPPRSRTGLRTRTSSMVLPGWANAARRRRSPAS